MASEYENPVKAGGVDTPQMVAAVVIGAVLALWLIARGFRGASFMGVSVGVS